MKPYVELPIHGGGTTKVDPDVAQTLEGKTLYRHSTLAYVVFFIGRVQVRLQRFICPAPRGLVVDHINGDGFDNRRANLRVTTYASNSLNQSILRSNKKTSRFRGVCFDKTKRRWKVRIGPGKAPYLRRHFHSEIVAALAVDDTLRRNCTYPGYLNFPKRIKRLNLGGFIRATKGRIFSVVFVRREDGAERRMVCRVGVKAGTTGQGLLFDPEQRDLAGVYDVQKKEYRFIPLENVLCLTFKKTRYAAVA